MCPLSKTGSSVCLPNEVRPIDLFSAPMKIHSTAATSLLRPWTLRVLHPSQFASKGGVLLAASKIAWLSETSLVSCRTLWGISLDFEKMFNMFSGLVAAQVASYMGLSFVNIMDLVAPLMCSVRIWRLPHSAAPTPFSTLRGLP